MSNNVSTTLEDLKKEIADYGDTLQKENPWIKDSCDYSINIKNIIEIEKNDNYTHTLEEELISYKNSIKKDFYNSGNYGDNLYIEVEKNCDTVMKIARLLTEEETNKEEAKNEMKNLLYTYIENDFIFGNIDNSYAFRGAGSNENLCDSKELYDSMNSSEIIFYRSRVEKDEQKIDKFSKIVSLPNSKKERASSGRFSKKGMPCLYLSLSSYTCFLEIGSRDNFEKLYTSAFKFNKEGLKKIKVLNLALYKLLLYGLDSNTNETGNLLNKIKTQLLKIAPLQIASSFIIKDKNRSDDDIRYEYLIPQCIIETLADIGSDENIYGVAYLSKKKEGKSIYPYCVNLAIPIKDLEDNEEFGKLYKYVEMTNPILNKDIITNYTFDKKNKKTYLENTFCDDNSDNNSLHDFVLDKTAKYVDTDYYKVDSYLTNMDMFNAMEKLESEREMLKYIL